MYKVAEKLEALSSIAHMVLDAQFTDFALREIIENRFSTNIWLYLGHRKKTYNYNERLIESHLMSFRFFGTLNELEVERP